MRCACIDIGTNTTRVLVADAHGGRLTEVRQERAFTRIGKGLRADGAIRPEKIAEVADVVAEQCRLAAELGAAPLRVVATAAIRAAANRDAFLAAVSDRAGVPVEVLPAETEARLAFVGATRTLGRALDGQVGVVDVGGGSAELAVGTLAGGVTWSASLGIGSGSLADHHLRSDPPSPAELAAARRHAHRAFQPVAAPAPDVAIAVGGSAASLRRLVGAVLEPASVERALTLLAAHPAAVLARRMGLDEERVRLLPAGILVLEAASQRFGTPLEIGNGGIREGVLLELAAGHGATAAS